MKLVSFSTLILVPVAVAFTVSPVSAQQGLEGAGMGSHNTAEDRYNSLRPAPPRRGKEKMEQVDAQKLPTKTVTDTTFRGSLLDAGLGSTGDTKSHEEKARSDSDKERPSKSADTGGDKEKVSKSTDSGGDGHSKDQKATPVRSDEKASGSPTEKASPTKTDGSH
jgi:hypothetical protein